MTPGRPRSTDTTRCPRCGAPTHHQTAHVLDHRCPRPPPATSTTPAAQQPHLF